MSSLHSSAAIAAATLLATGTPVAHHPHRHRHSRSAARHAPKAAHRHAGTAALGRAVPVRHRKPRAIAAHAARDPAVAIVDFRFAPSSITVHVGDSVTWTNTGTQPHTATANGHSFDTGVLSHGRSASHTFTSAGTFTYFCQIHPSMHGTIVVLASAPVSAPKPPAPSGHPSTPSAHGAASTAHTGGAASTAASAGPSLPLTGMNVGLAGAIGALLIAAGVAVRVVTRDPRREEQ